MRLFVTAFWLGAGAVAVIVIGLAFVVVLVADASGRTAVALAPAGLELVAFERRDGTSATTFGPGLLVLPAAGGLANALSAALVNARRRSAR